MTTHPNTEFTRPGDPSAKKTRQVGAPNHLQGSGETLMVSIVPSSRTGSNDSMVTSLFARLCPESHRFLSVDNRGRFTVSLDQLAELVAEIVTEYTDHVTAERDALAEDLAWELHATRGTAGGDV